MVPPGWGWRPYVEPAPEPRPRALPPPKPAPRLSVAQCVRIRRAASYRRVVAALLVDQALLDVPLRVLCEDVQARFKVRGDVARAAVSAARALAAIDALC